MATLVTGGTGFIGVEVVRCLLDRGETRPVVFSRNPSLTRLDDVADRVEVIRGDLGNFSHVLHAVKQAKPRVIYHLGAMLSVPSEADPAAAFQANAMGTFHVLEAARLFEVPQVLFSSSIGVYGLDITGHGHQRHNAATSPAFLRGHQSIWRAYGAVLQTQTWPRLPRGPEPLHHWAWGAEPGRGAVHLVGH
jgi:nucleoside-diphosphate-sugar epimerase